MEQILVKQRKKRAPNKNQFNYKETYYKPIGRLLICTHALNNESVPYLLIKHNTEHFSAVPTIRRTQISNEFRALLNNFLENNIISLELQKELTDKEQYLVEKLIYVAKIPEKFKFQSKTIDDYKKQFNFLKAALIAGSNSIELKVELKEIIILVSNPIVKLITQEDATDFIEIIDEMYM